MRKTMGVLLNAVRSPVEGVVGIYSIGLFAYAIYLVGPWYQGGYASVATQALQRSAEYGLGTVLIISAICGLVAPFMMGNKRRRLLKWSTFGIFTSFLFLTIIRIIIFGIFPVTWLPLILISLSSGYLHLWLKVRKE